jgi:hypothetical protein
VLPHIENSSKLMSIIYILGLLFLIDSHTIIVFGQNENLFPVEEEILESNGNDDLSHIDSENTVTDLCKNPTDRNASSIALETDKGTYAPLQSIHVYIDVLNGDGCKIISKVDFEISKILGNKSNEKVYVQHFFSDTMESQGFTDEKQVQLQDPGVYNLSASSLVQGDPEYAWKTIEIQEIYTSRFAFMWFLSAGFFLALVILILKGSSHIQLNEIFRFILISGIVFSLVSSFIFLNDEVSSVAPVGIVTKDPLSGGIFDIEDNSHSDNCGILGDCEWVLNIGGMAPRYDFGMQVPIGVIIFGIAGGYLRYLYKTSKLYKDYNNSLDKAINQLSDYRLSLFYRSLEDISLLFLSPLLAIAVWFLFDQAGMDSNSANSTIAVVSFTIGLITEDVIQALIRFSSSTIGGLQDKKKDNEKE